jgi:hypothetical protein
MGKLGGEKAPKEIVYGVVTYVGARRVRVLINGTKEIYAKCEAGDVVKTSPGTNVVLGFLDSGMDAYVMSVSTDILGGAVKAIIAV